MLFDIAVAGPLAGLVLAVPACVYGLMNSHIADMPPDNYATFGSSLFFQWLTDTLVGKPGPGQDVLLHPIAFAGWAGLFVTSLNLLPIGQLDGGHIAYALLGRRVAHLVAVATVVGLVALAVFVSPSWWFIAVLSALFGLRHPPTSDDWTPIDGRRMMLGVFLLLVFIVTFTPRPMR
jgi:membrane-associated protease RseP (regulator of RpoE activity)